MMAVVIMKMMTHSLMNNSNIIIDSAYYTQNKMAPTLHSKAVLHRVLLCTYVRNIKFGIKNMAW